MVIELVRGFFEDVSIKIPPEIPLERIGNVVPGWELDRHNDDCIAIKTKDQRNKTEVACVSEYKGNDKNLKEIREAVLRVVKISEQSNKVESQLKKLPYLNQLVYNELPVRVEDADVNDMLASFKSRKRSTRMTFAVDDFMYGFSKEEGQRFTVVYPCPFDEMIEKYASIPDKFVFLKQSESVDKKITYIS
jgi:hypothetical protein